MKTINQSEYLQLMGLLVLAKRHNDALNQIVDAVRAITGEEDDMGHSSDAVYSDYSADELLKKLDIRVID